MQTLPFLTADMNEQQARNGLRCPDARLVPKPLARRNLAWDFLLAKRNTAGQPVADSDLDWPFAGTVSPPLQISPNQGMQQCSSFVFSSGAHPGEVLVFVWNDIVGGRVITLRYANH